ncbi:hypothetical protein BH23BAC3_BH23BAC3_09190 [soil metagenome]
MPLLLTVLLTLLAFAELIPDMDQQQAHRIVLSLPEGFIPVEQHLAIANELNITLFELSDPVQLRNFPRNRYNYFVQPGPQYAVPGLLSQNISKIAEEIAEQYQRFEDEAPGRIVAASILRYPFERYPGFTRTAQSLADSLSLAISIPIYYKSAGFPSDSRSGGFNFISERVHPGQDQTADGSVIHFVPSHNQHESYFYLNQTMNRLQQFNESILILPAPWFFSQLETRSELRYLFRDYTEGRSIELPLPAQTQQKPSVNWSIILLLLLWGSFAIHFRYQPMYGQSIIRYFTNHSFFVTDVYEHRLRNVLPGFYLLIQHSLITGLFALASAEIILSDQGFAVLDHHFPAVMMFGENAFSLFIAGLLLAIVLQGISVLWIYFANTELTAFSQVLNLYSWPLHLNLLLVTLLIIFIQVGFNEYLILILGVIFILIWFFSFNIAVIDSSKFLETTLSKVLFLSLTAAIHLLLILGILFYMIYTPSILEPILFALEIP